MKKLIVEIADKYADAASMTFIGTNCAESEEIRMTVAAVALKPDITAIAVVKMGVRFGMKVIWKLKRISCPLKN